MNAIPLVDVLVIGCGPTGAVLANLLGLRGLTVAVVEREPEVYPVPRATHLDAETVRTLASTGLLEAMLPALSPFGDASVTDARGKVLLSGPVEPPAAPDDPLSGACFFHQPTVERVLRDGLSRFPNTQVHLGWAVSGLRAFEDHVEVALVAEGKAPRLVRARFVVGCDGGRSTVRSLLGVPVEELAPPRRWVVVDTRVEDPALLASLPTGFRYVVGGERLILHAHGHGTDRRWEIRLRHDDPDPDADTVRRWLAPHVDLDRTSVLRTATYQHRAQVARGWRKGRVLLAGDAAHLMPPFAGQGLCSGLRDAAWLAPALHRVVLGAADPASLDGYEAARRPHVVGLTRASVRLGAWLDTPRWAPPSWLRLRFALLGRLPFVVPLLQRLARPSPALA